MAVDMQNYDEIKQCLHCGDPIKVIKLSYIKKKIQNISDENLKLLKLCSKCKRKIVGKK